MTHLLDTDHISILQRPASPLYPVVSGHVGRHPRADLVVPVVSLGEQTKGVNGAVNASRTPGDVVRAYQMFDELLAFYRVWTVHPFDTAAAAVFDQLKAQKLRVGTMDLRIASIALANRLIVVTRNISDFGQVPGLVTEDWTK